MTPDFLDHCELQSKTIARTAILITTRFTKALKIAVTDHCLSQVDEIVTVKLSRVLEIGLEVGKNHLGNF